MNPYKKITLRFILYIILPTAILMFGIFIGSAATTDKYDKEAATKIVIDKFNVISVNKIDNANYLYYLRDTITSKTNSFFILLPTNKFEKTTFILSTK